MGAYAFMRTLVQTRSRGHSAVGAVAYRFGLVADSSFAGDDGQPRSFDYSARRGIAASGAALPAGAGEAWSDPLEWAHRVEAVDRRKNSRQCRDDVVGIPIEIVESGEAEAALAAYAQRVSERWRTPVHWVIHDATSKNPHAHVLYAGRQLEASGDGFAASRDRGQDAKTNAARGQLSLPEQHKVIWTEVLAEHGVTIEFGPNGEDAQTHIGPGAWAIEKALIRDETANRIAAALDPNDALDEGDLAQLADLAIEGITVSEALHLDRVPVTRPFRALPRRADPKPLPQPPVPAIIGPASLPWPTLPAIAGPEPLPFLAPVHLVRPEPLPRPAAQIKKPLPLLRPAPPAIAEPPPLPQPRWWPSRLAAASIKVLQSAGDQLQDYLDELVHELRDQLAQKNAKDKALGSKSEAGI